MDIIKYSDIKSSMLPVRAHPSMYRLSKRRKSNLPLKLSHNMEMLPINVIIENKDKKGKCMKQYERCMKGNNLIATRVSARKSIGRKGVKPVLATRASKKKKHKHKKTKRLKIKRSKKMNNFSLFNLI